MNKPRDDSSQVCSCYQARFEPTVSWTQIAKATLHITSTPNCFWQKHPPPPTPQKKKGKTQSACLHVKCDVKCSVLSTRYVVDVLPVLYSLRSVYIYECTVVSHTLQKKIIPKHKQDDCRPPTKKKRPSPNHDECFMWRETHVFTQQNAVECDLIVQLRSAGPDNNRRSLVGFQHSLDK